MIFLGQDPLDLESLTRQLADSVAHFQKGAYAIKGGHSDPTLIRGLQVELPEDLGGKMSFSDIANVGPKPGEARSLLITVFDAQVHISSDFAQINLIIVYKTYYQSNCTEST
jgi:ribosome recycling factor